MMWVGDKSDPESKVYNNQSVGTLTEEGDDEEGDEDAGGEPMWRPGKTSTSLMQDGQQIFTLSDFCLVQ